MRPREMTTTSPEVETRTPSVCVEGLQLEQLMSHYIIRTAVATVAKYDLRKTLLTCVWIH